jgi:hypothetical protein
MRLTGRTTTLLTIVAVAFTMASAPAARAVPPSPQPFPTNGQITYLRDGTAYTANADGSNERVLATGVRSVPAWSPDGSRFVVENSSGALVTRRADGSDEVLLTAPGETGTTPAWAPFGAVIYSSQGRLKLVGSDGGWWRDPFFPPPPGSVDTEPTVNQFGQVLFTRSGGGLSGIYRFDLDHPAQPTLIVPGGRNPSFETGGVKFAYILEDEFHAPQVWYGYSDGNYGGGPLTGELEGHGTVKSNPVWSPDNSAVLFVGEDAKLMMRDPDNIIPIPVGRTGTDTAWQPVSGNFVARVWGQDHVDTAVAASQARWANTGTSEPFRAPAGAVVLSRDDTYLDALAGSALAIDKWAPLLLTNRLALDGRVEREINRILGGHGTVYVLGGVLAIRPEVTDRLTALGYSVQRLWGETHFDTAVQINRTIAGQSPRYAIVTTGTNYYDALAAGAVAGAQPGTVIVLTDHDRMPQATVDYLNTLTPATPDRPDEGTWIVTAGGPGDRALINTWAGDHSPLWRWLERDRLFPIRLVGQNEMDTALLIANQFFAVPFTAALATNRTWFDALTGGAMIGAGQGPLLITDPTGLYPPVRDYLSRNSGRLVDAVLLGGPAALPTAMEAPVCEAIGLPGQCGYRGIQPGAYGSWFASSGTGNVRPAEPKNDNMKVEPVLHSGSG